VNFIPLLVANWRVIALGLVVLAVGGYVWSCERAKDKLVAQKVIAEQQAVENAKQAFRDLKNKERADEEYERRINRLRADVKRLRDASSSLLPPAPAGTPSPERACFDRADLDRALSDFARGAADLVGEGAAAVEGLDTAKGWAKNR
jgi:hypothetical protein